MRWRKLLALGLLLLVPAAVYAQVVAQDGQRTDPGRTGTGQALLIGGINRSDTTMRILTMDGSGYPLVTESSPARTDFLDGTTPIISDSMAVGMADSSSVINMGKYRVWGLAIKMSPTAGGTTRIAVSLRFHLSSLSDTSSIFPISPRRSFTIVTTAVANDSTQFTIGSPGTSVAFSDREFLIVATPLGGRAAKWENTNCLFIPLTDALGCPVWAPYISVRLRNLGGPGPVFETVYLVGTPL